MSSKLKEVRESLGVTKTELAYNAGVSEVSITKYETGERRPSDEVKVKIANFLGKTVQEIFFN